MGDETSQRGPFLLNYQRRRRCRQCGARAEPATQSQCCGEPGAVEGDPLARQRPVEVDAAVDRLHPVSESAKQKKKNLSARRRWGHRTPCWLRPRAREWVMKLVNAGGWRHVKVTDRHTAVDYAHVLKDLADVHFADAGKIVLVQDNLNIHCRSSLYEAFPAPEARRLVEHFEWHFTPKHGSWLDLAESELGVLASQCLDRRIPDKRTLIDEIAAWEHDRNANHTTANWHFTTPNARVKLKHLYPSL